MRRQLAVHRMPNCGRHSPWCYRFRSLGVYVQVHFVDGRSATTHVTMVSLDKDVSSDRQIECFICSNKDTFSFQKKLKKYLLKAVKFHNKN